ncbi:MAG: pirin-like C-terminal cupin domain-containing protein, partial [Pleurocapsa sp.]
VSLSSLLYCDLSFETNGTFTLKPEYRERAIYTVTKGITIDGDKLQQHRIAIISLDSTIELSAKTKARCMLIAGEPVGKRYKWRNYVSRSKARIEQAKEDWQAGKFPQVPDENEFISLPEDTAPL